jgi:TonB-linked SusC/RagA family outer membrane protein
MLLLLAPSASAQTGSVVGRVTDQQTGEPIAAAQVFVADLELGALTQQNGSYLLVNVPTGEHTVTVQLIGYSDASQVVTVTEGGTAVLDFRIAEEALQLQEVIVTGTAGGSARRALGNSIEVLSAADVTDQAPVSGIQGLMAARTPGLRFSRTAGEVGAGSSISVRGIGSTILGNQPLVYVDGVRVNNDGATGPNTGGSQNASALNDLNPEDIESIEVIKGPSAATLYGTEASAGVIQIITKRGNVGAPRFEIEVAGGSNFMPDPTGRIGTQYVCQIAASQCPADQIYTYNMYQEAGDYLRGTGRYAGLPNADDPAFAVNSHFVPNSGDSDLFQYGPMQQYNGSVRGGLDQVRYYAGVSWLDETGITDFNTNQQVGGRSNVTVLFGPNINVDLSVGYTQGKSRFGTVDEEGGYWTLVAAALGANLPGVRPDNPATPGVDESLGSGFLGFYQKFPEAWENTDISRAYSRFTGSATMTHDFGGWFSQRLTFGLDRGTTTDTEYLPPESDFQNGPQGYLAYGRPITENVTLDYSASGAYDINQSFRATTSVGAQYYARRRETLEATGRDFPTSVQTVIDQTEFANRELDFSSVENKGVGVYFQEELSYQDRIFLTGAVRADDNSAFGSDFAVQYYPKLSASWVISEEPFWSFDFMNSLRLRGAWGQSGRQPDTFASQTLYETFQGHDGNGLIPSQAGNPDIGPEVSEEIEVGFDMALLQDRIAAEFSYYTTTTRDMLVNQSLAPTTGLVGSRQANLGSMDVWGWEASLDTRIIRTENVGFDITLSADYSNNEIKSLGEDVLASGNLQIGWPFPNVASAYIIRSADLNTAGTALDLTSVMCDGGVPAVSGGPNIIQGGETIPCSSFSEDGLLLGPAYSNYSISVAPTLTLFNDLQLFALAEGQYGRWIAQIEANYACGFFRNCLKAIQNNDPVWIAGKLFGPYPDDRYQARYPADFWRLRQLGFRYNLPESIVGRIGADRAAFSFSVNNLFLLYQRVDKDLEGQPIYDPEYANNGGGTPNQISLWETPPIASISARLRVTF